MKTKIAKQFYKRVDASHPTRKADITAAGVKRIDVLLGKSVFAGLSFRGGCECEIEVNSVTLDLRVK